jgi:hypothetical protein
MHFLMDGGRVFDAANCSALLNLSQEKGSKKFKLLIKDRIKALRNLQIYHASLQYGPN